MCFSFVNFNRSQLIVRMNSKIKKCDFREDINFNFFVGGGGFVVLLLLSAPFLSGCFTLLKDSHPSFPVYVCPPFPVISGKIIFV